MVMTAPRETLTRQKTPSTNRRRTAAIRDGFQTLTLDPTPRIKRVRVQARSHVPTAEAWMVTARALWQATRSLGTSLRRR